MVIVGSILFSVQAVDAQTIPDALKNAPKSMGWAVFPFQTSADEPNPNWAQTLPKILTRGWDRVVEHVLTEDEIKAYQVKLRKAALLQSDVETSQKLLERDQIVLNNADPSTALGTWKTDWDKLQVKRTSIDQWPVDMIDIPTKLPFKMVTTGKDGFLADPISENPDVTATKLGLDLWVQGRFKSIAGYLSVKIVFYSAIESKALATWESIFAPEEAAAKMQEAREKLLQSFLGRPWWGIEVRSPQSGSMASLQGGPFQPIPLVDDFLTDPKVKVVVRGPNRITKELEVSIDQNTIRTVDVELDTDTLPPFDITSDPPGASVWIDSQYVGATPLSINKPLHIARVKFVRPGYIDAYAEITQKTTAPLFVLMTPEGPSVDLIAYKDRFYTSLAFFSFSLTSTIFMKAFSDQYAGITLDYGTQYLSNPVSSVYSNYAQAYYTQQGFTYAYYSGAALTAGLFVWMMFELADYIKAAEDPLK